MSQLKTLVTRREVERLTGFSRPWIYAQMRSGRFPRPVRIGPKAVRWVLGDVQRWIEDRIAEDRDRRAKQATAE